MSFIGFNQKLSFELSAGDLNSCFFQELALQEFFEVMSVFFDLLLLSISAFLGYESFYELFRKVQNVHTPRIQISWETSNPKVEFFLNIPTLMPAMGLLGALVCIYTSLRLLSSRFGNKARVVPKKYKIYQIAAFIFGLLSYLIAIQHFFATAGQFG